MTRDRRKKGEKLRERKSEKYGGPKKYFPVLPKASRDTNDYGVAAVNMSIDHFAKECNDLTNG